MVIGTNVFLNNFKYVFPEIFFITAIIIVLLYAVAYPQSRSSTHYPIRSSIVAWLSIQILLITLFLQWNIPSSSVALFQGVLIIDDLTLTVRTLVLISALSSILISLGYIRGRRINSFEYIILILFATFSTLLLISSYDLISIYLAIELQTLCFYVLAAFKRNDEFSAEAGLKYFVLGALSSGLLLFGEAIIYGSTGATNLEELTKFYIFSSVNTSYFGEAGIFLMLVAFLFKISAVPFHAWTPDVYEGAPTSVTAFFAITPKIAILSLLLRLSLCTFYDLIEWWQLLIVICSFLSMFIGTFGAINQNRMKRLFAYSSIAHVGYILIALATGSPESVQSLLIYITIYIVMIINVFGVVLVLSRRIVSPTSSSLSFELRASENPLRSAPTNFIPYASRRDEYLKYFTDLSHLAKANPILSLSLATILFSNAGVPPLAGFYGKLNVFLSAMESSMYFLALSGIICSVAGAFYSIRLVKTIYYHNGPSSTSFFRPISREAAIILSLTFFFTFFFFTYPSFLFTITHSAALCLC